MLQQFSEFDRHREKLIELGLDPDDAISEVLKDMGLSVSQDEPFDMEDYDAE